MRFRENRKVACVINAGYDQTTSCGATVTLHGESDAPQEDIATYEWEQLSGPRVFAAGPYYGKPFGVTGRTQTFKAPKTPCNLVFECSTVHFDGSIETDTVTIA